MTKWDRPPGLSSATAIRGPGLREAATVRRYERFAEIAGLTDESVCPTLARISLRFCGAGAFACQELFSERFSHPAPR